jgi:GT2 family glycosyltransferase
MLAHAARNRHPPPRTCSRAKPYAIVERQVPPSNSGAILADATSPPARSLFRIAAVTDAPRVSLTAIARARIPELDRLVDVLLAIDGPLPREIVIGVETPGTTSPTEAADERGVRWIALPPGRGIGYNRNRVLDAVHGEIVVGVDDDCVPKLEWLAGLCAALEDPNVHGAIGEIELPPAGFVGDSISALGFPAGGSEGYANMFRVDADSTTYNIAAGNCALRTATVRELGGFDESLSWGGEDTALARRFIDAGKRLVFVPRAVIVHPARTSLAQFARWMVVRGRAKRQFARTTTTRGLVGARLASFGGIVKRHARDPKLVLIVPLLAASLILQQAGFVAETISPRR